jgi:D-tagatose-1,6-bisphosphate aldolase subunit GatZ/KbaZ
MTSPDALDEAVHLTREGFASYGIAHAWERVVAVVVDAGVGFSNLAVADYRPDLAAGLVRRLRNHPGLVFEAHATDYQRPEGLRRMVEDGFAVLKVGPELTFRFREAVFALALLERELLRGKKSSAPSRLVSVLDREMVDDPRHWRSYYRCAGEPEHLLRRYALTDRCRYYWSRPAVAAALARLFDNLRRRVIPLPLLSQYLPDLVEAVRSGAVEPSPESLVRARIQGAWRRYLSACYTDPVLPPGPPPGR